jgi:hypothetical protein
MLNINLGGIERLLRFIIGLALAGWALSCPEMDSRAWLMSIIALFLVLNGLFGRCYLWHVLDFSSCGCNRMPQGRFCDRSPA